MRIAAVALLFLATNSFATDWAQVTTNDKAFFAVDVSSIRKEGNYITFWERDILLKPTNSVIAYVIKNYGECREKKSHMIVAAAFNKKGDRVEQQSFSSDKENAKLEHMIIGTPEYKVLSFACDYSK